MFLVLDAGSAGGQPLTVTTCQGGTPGCELRAPTHQHANFALVIRGQSFDFGQPAFLSTENEERSATVHIHEPRFDVVHVHRTATTWDELLRSVGFLLQDPTLPGVSAGQTCLALPDSQRLCTSGAESFKFYVNGVRVDGIAFTAITDLDKVLISFGGETDAQVVSDQLSLTGDDACIPSERCKDRIPLNEPPEQCTKSNDSCAKLGG